MFNWQAKKIISIILIVATVFANNAFFVFAEGVNDIIEESKYEEKEIPNYYEESEEFTQIIEEQTIVEEYETYLEENNPGVFEHEEKEESIASDSDIEYIDAEENEEEIVDAADVVEPEEDEKKLESEEGEEGKEVEASESEIEEENNETEQTEEAEENISTESKTTEENKEVIASESEVEKETEEKEKNISTESEIIKESIVATSTELEKEKVTSTESEIEKTTSTESEAVASESEIKNASESEIKNVIIATLSRARWKVKKIFIATYSRTYAFASENNATKISRLATCANVIIVDEEGNEKLINVPLKWKHEKTIPVNEKVTRNVKPRGVDAWRKELKVDKTLKENAKEIIVATDSFDRVAEKIKKENEEKTEKEIVIVAEDLKNQEETLEKKEEKIEETKNITNENIIAAATESIVVDFSSSDISTKSEIKNISTESVVDKLVINETEEVEDIEIASVSIVKEENYEIEKVNENEIEIESGVAEKKEFTDYQLGFMQLETIDLYKVDTDALGADIVKAIEDLNEKKEATESDATNDGKEKTQQTLFGSILDFFGITQNKNSEKQENELENKEKEESKEKTEEEKLIEALNNAKIETLDACEVDSLFAETDNMMFGADAEHYYYAEKGVHHSARDLIVETPAAEDWITKNIRITEDVTLASMWPGIPSSGTTHIGGTFFLPSDITISCQVLVDTADLEICTNGYSITFATMGYIKASNGKKVGICNCVPSSVRESVITTTGPTYGVKDRYYSASLSDVYTKYHDKPIIEGEYIDVIGQGGKEQGNIVFKNCQIKNDYVGKNAVSHMSEGNNEPDYPETSGGGSILHATKKLNVYSSKFEANIATRTNGVAINTQMGELNVEACTFKDNINKTNVAGAIAFNPRKTTIFNSHFENNASATSGGALYGRVFDGSEDGTGTVIEKTIFKENKAVLEGGAIYLDYQTNLKIGSEENEVTFENNKAGIFGGAISLNHTPMILKIDSGSNYDFEKFPGFTPSTEPYSLHGKITFDHVTMKNNNAKKQIAKSDGKIIDAPVASMSENAGGAIYINNKHYVTYGESQKYNINLLDEININNSVLEGNIAHGMKLEVKLGGDESSKVNNYLNNYGGAIYVKNLDELNINSTDFKNNRSMTGAAICAYNSKINVAGGSFVGGQAYLDEDDAWINGKDLLKRIITSGGGAIYLMDGAKANLLADVEIKENRNAFYLDGGEINIGKSKVTDNIGEYLIGYSNYTVHPSSRIASGETDASEIIKPYENRIMFSGVDIHKHTFYGPGKNYKADPVTFRYIGASSDTTFNAKETNTYLSFNGINSINNNKWYITAASGLTTKSEITEYCNIPIISSTSNLKFDLSDSTMKKPPKVNAAGDEGGKIGIYYYIADPDGVDDQIVYDKWNTTDCRVFREGGIWSNYFEVDQSKRYGGSTEDLRLEGWKFYRKQDSDTIRISPNIFVVKFDSYIEGVEEIDEQYYNYKRDNQLISIATPTEIVEGAINIPGKSFIGVLGRDSSPTALASGSYVLWDFDKCKLRAVEQEDDEEDAEVMILIYADDDVKVKACGCKSGEPCHHENGVNHADRGLAPSNSGEVKEKNYIMVATWPQLIYKHNNKRTQYVLNKDISIGVEQAKKFLYGETVLNLNGHTLYVDTSAASSSGNNIFNAKLGSKSNIEEEDASIFIAGKATTADVQRGKIVVTNYQHPLIDVGSAGVYISDVDIENMDSTDTNSHFIIGTGTEKNDKQYITLNNVTFNNVNTSADFITGLSKAILKNVKIDGNFKLNDNDFVSLKSDPTTTKRMFKLIDSDIEGMENIASLYKNNSGTKTTEVIIASSNVIDNKFKESLIDAETINAKSTISFIGKNIIKDNEVLTGKYLINATHGDTSSDTMNLIFGDNDSDNTFEGNKVPDVDGNAIIHITKKSKVSFKGLNKFIDNKAEGSTNVTSTIYQDADTTVNLGQAGIKVINNDTKYNWYMKNDTIADNEKMKQIPGTLLKASDSKIAIRVENADVDQLIYKNWGKDHLYNLNSSENVFDQDPSYGNEKPNSYKVGIGTESNIYFGNDFVFGEFRYYSYQNGVDERISGTYDVDVAKDSVQRLKKDSYVVLDMPRITNGNDIMWEGLRTYNESYSSPTRTYDISTESRLPLDVIRVRSNKNFELSGYKYRKANGTKHMHDDIELWVEARNEGHLQATSSYAYLHNDMHISRELLYDLEGDFILCLNGHTLTIDKDMDWLKMNKNCKISICDHEGNAGKVTMNSTIPLTKDLITVNDGTLDLSNIEVTGFKANDGRFVNVNANVNANIENTKISINTIDYSSDISGIEKAFIDINESAIATYSNIELDNNHISTNETNGEKQYVMSIKTTNASSKDYDFAGLRVNNNIVEKGRGSILHIKGYKNVLLDSIEVKNNEAISGTAIDIEGSGVGIASITDATFVSNIKNQNSSVDIPQENSANFGIKGFAKLNMQGGSITESKYVTGANNTEQVHTTLYINDIESEIRGVTFDNCNVVAAGSGISANEDAIAIKGANNVTFEDCTFKNTTANTYTYMHVESSAKTVFKGNTTFNNIKAKEVLQVKTGTVEFDGVNMDGTVVTIGAINVQDGATFIASGSVLKNTTGTTINVNSDNVKFYDTEITGNGGTAPAVAIFANKKITIGRKVIIKGYNTNLALMSGAKIVGEESNKIADGSEISITSQDNNYNFFDTWSNKYIEKFNYHNFDTDPTTSRWYYLPSDVFKADATSKQIYVADGTVNDDDPVKVYIGDKGTSIEYATLIYLDAEVRGSMAAPIEITRQYVKSTTSDTRLDRVHVNYLSTSSQYWITPFNGSIYPDDINPGDNHKVTDNIMVNNLTPGEEYKIYLSKKHIHKECGLDTTEPCIEHIDGDVHSTVEHDFKSIISNEDFLSKVSSFDSFGLDKDVTIKQDVLDAINAKAAPVYICLHGNVLTFDTGAHLDMAQKLIITDCTGIGYITASNSEATNTLINATGELKIYNTTFKLFDADKTVVVAGGTKTYFENSTFSDIRMTNASSGPIVKVGGNNYIDRLSINHNTATYSSLLIFNSTEKLESDKIKTFDVSNNIYSSKLISIDAGAHKAPTFTANNNIMVGTESGVYGTVYIGGGASLEITEDFTMEGNDAITNPNSKGGAFTVENGTLKFDKKVLLSKNKSSYGGAVYLGSSGNLEVALASHSTFENNEAKYGAAIYAEALTDAKLKIPEAVFDGNKPTENGVIAWDGTLTLNKITFKNQRGKSIIYNTKTAGTDALNVDNVIFNNNAIDGDAIELNHAGVVNIKNISEKTKNNTFRSFISVNNTSAAVNISDSKMTDNTYADATIKLSTSSNVTLMNLTLTNNRTANGALSIQGAPVTLKKPMYIAQNRESKDIYVKGDNAFVKWDVSSGILSSPSRLGFSAAVDGVKVFEKWNSSYIDKYDMPDETLAGSRKYAHTPENSEIVYASSDAGSRNYELYKNNEDLYIGSSVKFAKVSFIYDEEGPTVTYLTQNIARNVSTKLDKVDVFGGIPLDKQSWDIYKEDGTSAGTIWKFADAGSGWQNVNTASPVVAKYIKPHLHKVCGYSDCNEHADFATHTGDIEFERIRNVSTIETSGTNEYFALENDIYADHMINIVANYKGMCLNGHKIIASGSMANVINVLNTTGEFTICDCKHTGGFAMKETATVSNAFVNNSNNSVTMYGLVFDNVNMENTYVAAAVNNVTINGATFSNIKKMKADGILDSTKVNNFANITFINNTLETDSTFIDMNNTADIYKGNLKLVNNKTTKDFIKLYGVGGIDINEIYVKGNTTNMSIIVATNSAMKAKGAVDLIGNITKKSVINLNNTPFDFENTAKVNAENNTNNGSLTIDGEGRGGVVYMVNRSSLKIATSSTFTGNKAADGAAIYARELTNESTMGVLSLTDTTFENNSILGSDGHGVINYGGYFDIKDMAFKGNQGTELIYAGTNTDNTLKSINATFINNNTSKDAIYIKNATNSYFSEYEGVNSAGNTFANFINVENGDMTLSKVNISASNNKYNGAIFNVKNSTASVLDNVIIEGAQGNIVSVIKLDDAKVKVKGKVVVNVTAGKNVILIGDSYLKGYGTGNAADKLSSDSLIHITSAGMETKIFEDWNEKNIENCNNPKYSTPDTKYMYTPENSGLFVIDDAKTIYKKGTNSDIYVGNDYIELTFIRRYNDEDDPEDPYADINLGTQKIAKSIETFVDRVDIFDYDVKQQEWEAPGYSNWKFVDKATGFSNVIKADYSEGKQIFLVSKHIHRICGGKLTTICDHDNDTLGFNHEETPIFIKIKTLASVAEAQAEAALTPGEKHYLSLTGDIKAVHNDSLFSSIFNDFDGLCLNGHSISYVEPPKNPHYDGSTIDGYDPADYNQAVININKNYTICDCKSHRTNHGKITNEPGAVKQGMYISVGNGIKLALYNIHFDGANVKDAEGPSIIQEYRGCLIYTEGVSSEVYFDKPEFTNFTTVGKNGLFSGKRNGVDDKGKITLSSPSIINNDLGLCDNPIIQLNNRLKISTLSVIGNNGLGGLIDVNDTSPVSIGKMIVQGNSSNGNGIITISYGQKLIITEENEFIGNTKSIKGGVFYISGELETNKEIIFKENTSNGQGGAVYITRYTDDASALNPTSGKIIAHATISFIRNTANNGATIYANNIDDDALQFEKIAIFDNNSAKTNVVTWKGNLNLSNVVFKNHKTTTNMNTILLQNVEVGGKLKLSDVTFINNDITGSAMILNGIASPSYISNIHSNESKDNKTDNLFYIKNDSAIEIKDLDIHDFTGVKSIFKIENSPKTVLSNVKMKNNHTSDGVVQVVNGALGIKNKIEIGDNEKDLYLTDNNSFLKGVGDAINPAYIDAESKISIDTYGDNAKIFEGWNGYNIEKYDNPDKHETPIEYMYTPEGNAEHPGIFVSKNADWKVYKSGLDGDVKLGTNFVTLTFNNNDSEKPDDVPFMDFNGQTQNIEKGVATRIDKVNSFEYEVGRQDWRAPSNTDESVTTLWHFPDPTLATIHPELSPTAPVIAKYEDSHEIIYVYKHIHKVCGLTMLNECNHTYGDNHDPLSDASITTVEYTAVDSISGPEGINNVPDSVEYIGLKNDIIVETEPIRIKPNIKGICLNGHSIIANGGSASPIIVDSGRGGVALEICNCRNHKEDSAFTLAENKTLSADYIKLSENDVDVNIRKVKFSKINTSKPIINISYPNDNIMLEDVTFKELKGVSDVGVLATTNPTKYKIADLKFVNNNNQTTGPLVTLVQGMQISTVSFIGNTLKGSAFAISGTPVIGSLDVRNNETTANGIISVPNGAILQIDKAITFDHNKAEKGGAIYIANGGKFIAQDKAVFTNNTAVGNGGAIYMAEGAIVNFNSDVRFENNTAIDGSAIYAEKLGASDFITNSNKEIIFTKEKATGKGVIAWGGELTLASASFIDNQSGCGELLTNIHIDGTDKLNLIDVEFRGNNGVKGAIALDHVGASIIKDVKVNENTFTNAGLYIVNNSIVTMDTPEIKGNTSGTYGAIYIKDTDNVKTIGNMTVTNNTTSGSYGAAITLENVHQFDNMGTGFADSKIDISGNKSASGGAVYLKNAVMAVAGIVNIVGNNLNNNAARNIFITDGESFVTACDWIEADSKMGFTVGAKNYKVFEGWNNTNFHKYDNPDSDKTAYTPENSGIFLADAGLEFYKSGTGDTESIKLGDNFAKLTFCTSDKANIYATQNIEKDVDTKLDIVKINHSNYGSEKWVAPNVVNKWIFADGDIIANYNANQFIIKSFIYHIRFTAGSKEGKPGLSGYMDNATYEYGDTVAIPACAYIYENPDTHLMATFRKWRIKTPVNDMPTEFAPGDLNIRNLSIGEGHDVVLEAAWEGEFAVRYFPNGEKIGQSIPYNESFMVISDVGVPVTVAGTYQQTIGKYSYSSYTTEPYGGSIYGIGSAINGNNNEIKLYCNWEEIKINNRRSGGGGGGGGGNGRSISSSGGMWINGVWVPFEIDPLHPVLPTQGQYYVDAYGNIKAPTGEIVGNVNLGDKVNADGTFTDVNGNTHLLDGSVRDINGITYNVDGSLSMPDGRVYYVDGSIKDKDGTIYHKDGTVTMPDGTVKDNFGLLHRVDGSIVTKDGTIYYTDGSIEYPDGTKLLPDGTIIKVDKQAQKNVSKNTEGAWEYDPVTGGWKFFSVDNITGQKSYYKDDWILTADKKGESKWYAVDTFGNMVTGWVKVDGDFYYMSPNADTRGELVKGTITIAGKTYKLDPETGKLLDNQIPTNFNVLGAENHRSGIDGNWRTNPATGKRQFIKQNKRVDGKLISEELAKGWYMVDGYYYNFDEDGDANTGLIISDGKYYFMEADGHMLEGGERVIDKITYVFDKATGACRSSYVDPKNL